MDRMSWAGLREAGTNLSLAALYALFALAHGRAFAAHPRASLLLLVVLEGAAAALLLARSRATEASLSPYSWLTTIGGTFTPMLLRPGPATADSPVGQVIQAVGAALAVIALLSLWRSFGLLPAVRTLRVEGAYRWVRHPLYLAYTVLNVGYLLSNHTAHNLAVVLAGLLFQVLRVYDEERVLFRLPSYRDYARRTRWRMVPRVF
jgi:protein-S-isoprenylcysteine O-methyltransferase Ste14